MYLPSVIWLWIPGPYFPSHLLCIQDMMKWKPSNSWMMNIVLYVFICQLHFQSMWTVSFQVQVCPELLCIRYTSCDERITFQLQYNSMYVQLCVYHICVNYICIPICLVHLIQSELKIATWIMFMYTCEEIKTLHQPPNPKFQKPFTLNIFFYFTIA